MSQPRGPKRPAGEPVKWQLQVEGGRTVGPLTTEDLLLRISQGILTGEEKIRKLPDGQWSIVSREGIFYDKLLEALNEDNEKTLIRTNVAPANPPPATSAEPPEPPAPEEPKEPLKLQTNSTKQELPESTTDKSKSSPFSDPFPSDPFEQFGSNLPQQPMSELHLSNTPARVPTLLPEQTFAVSFEEKKSGFGFGKFMIAVIAILAIYIGYSFLFDTPGEVADTGLRIKIPRPSSKTTLQTDQQNHALAEIYRLIFLDSIHSYDQAQDKLIGLIEKAPLTTEPRGLLCLVHMHLWPYVKQSSRDLDNLKRAKLSGTGMDPVGLGGIHCEVSYLMVMGKYRDAMGLIEHTSNRREISEESPVLYSTKAEVMASEKNYREAVAWAEAAAKLWPQWAHPYYQMASYNFEVAEYEKAVEGFEKVLSLNPKHRAALISYGVLIYLHLKDSKRAEKFLTAAKKVDDEISKTQEAQMYYYLARISGEKNLTEQALEYVQKSFQLNPGDLKARDYLIQLGGSPTNIARQNQHNELVFLGDQYSRAGDYLAAQAEYKAAFDVDHSNALAAMKAAKALWQLYQAEEALKWLGKAIVADPKLSIPYFLMADYYSQLYNFPAAGDILARGAQKLPNNPDILRGYGLVELRRNNHKQAITYLEKALKATEDVDTLALLAKAYLTSRDGADPQKAMTYATKAIQLEDANPEAQIIYAKVLVVLSGVPAAVSYMKERILKFSYTPEYILGLAEIYKEAEMFRQAQGEYEKIFLLDNKNKKALMGLGACYQAQSILDKALKMYLAAAYQDPTDPEPVYKAGSVYMDAGRFKDALTEYKRGIGINKVYPKGYYNFGRAAFALKDYPLALSASTEEKKNNPSLADAYILAGETYRETHDYNKCASEYQQAVRLRPKGAENYVKLAQCQIWAGNIDVAENMLAIAKEQENGYADIYKFQGSIFEKRGESREACLAFQNYISLAPNAGDRKDIDDKINNLCGGR